MSAKYILLTVLVIAGVWIAATAALLYVTRPEPACHSVTEDSAPYDCDYDGQTNEWRPKR